MVIWENKLVNMEKITTSAEARQKSKEKEKIAELAGGSLPVKNQYWEISINFFRDID